MPDLSYYSFTGQVIKIVAHTGQSLIFVLHQSFPKGDSTFHCVATGATARYLSGRLKPMDYVYGNATLAKNDKKGITLLVSLLYKVVPGWGGSRIKPKSPTKPKKSILYNPQ